MKLNSAGKASAISVSERWIDLRMISAMRVVLALCALLVIYIDPSEPDRLVVPTYLAVAGYAAYSILVFLFSTRLGRILPLQVLHWIDVTWYRRAATGCG